jgi:DNA-binding response OmpR family regulator
VEDMTLDLLARTVRRGTVQLDLPQRQFELLAYLMKHPGETVSRQMIAEHVWKESSATWTNVIEVQVNQLRKKLHLEGLPPVLHTVRGRGYRIGSEA